MTSIQHALDHSIRPDLRQMSAYHVPSAAGMVKLDAMENPFRMPPEYHARLGERLAQVDLQRYPVPTYSELKQRICHTLGVPQGHEVVLGNGSDELITMLALACVQREQRARVLAPVPGFVMYAMTAQLLGLDFIGVPLKPDFSLDLEAMLAAIHAQQPQLIFLAYPNNPTANLFSRADIEAILRASRGIVVVDEAYQPFANDSFMPQLLEYENLVVMRTVSKMGLAGIRLGYMSAHPALLAEIEKLRPPYNVNVLSEACALFALEHAQIFKEQAAQICAERTLQSARLQALPGVEVFPSQANFLLLRLKNADQVFSSLLEQGVLVKNVGKMHALLANCLRVTIGTAAENLRFYQALENILARTA